jgi:hypothetical protein
MLPSGQIFAKFLQSWAGPAAGSAASPSSSPSSATSAPVLFINSLSLRR